MSKNPHPMKTTVRKIAASSSSETDSQEAPARTPKLRKGEPSESQAKSSERDTAPTDKPKEKGKSKPQTRPEAKSQNEDPAAETEPRTKGKTKDRSRSNSRKPRRTETNPNSESISEDEGPARAINRSELANKAQVVRKLADALSIPERRPTKDEWPGLASDFITLVKLVGELAEDTKALCNIEDRRQEAAENVRNLQRQVEKLARNIDQNLQTLEGEHSAPEGKNSPAQSTGPLRTHPEPPPASQQPWMIAGRNRKARPMNNPNPGPPQTERQPEHRPRRPPLSTHGSDIGISDLGDHILNNWSQLPKTERRGKTLRLMAGAGLDANYFMGLNTKIQGLDRAEVNFSSMGEFLRALGFANVPDPIRKTIIQAREAIKLRWDETKPNFKLRNANGIPEGDLGPDPGARQH